METLLADDVELFSIDNCWNLHLLQQITQSLHKNYETLFPCIICCLHLSSNNSIDWGCWDWRK